MCASHTASQWQSQGLNPKGLPRELASKPLRHPALMNIQLGVTCSNAGATTVLGCSILGLAEQSLFYLTAALSPRVNLSSLSVVKGHFLLSLLSPPHIYHKKILYFRSWLRC